MALALIPDHYADGVRLLISQYQDKPVLAAVLKSYLKRGNDVEAMFWQLLTDRTIDNAVGVQLDILGKLVGQPRIGPDDATYRLFIRTRIRANRSKGQSADIIAVTALATSNAAFVVHDLYPASIIVDVLSALALPALAPFIAQILRDTAGAGVALSFHWNIEAAIDTFTLSNTDFEVLDAARGLSNDAGTTGGHLLGAF